MRKTATKAIKDLQTMYTDTVQKIAKVRNSDSYTEEYKAQLIDKIMSEYTDKIESYKAKALDSVKAIQTGLTETRHIGIRMGLSSAEIVNSIVNGIGKGIYSEDMIRDLISVHADNPYATKTIRGALMASDNDTYKSIGLEIPVSSDDRIARNLDNIVRGINEMPSPTATENGQGNFSTGFYQSGQTFDSWANYINDNIDDDE